MSEYEVGRKYPVRRELAFPQVDRDRKTWKHIVLRRRESAAGLRACRRGARCNRRRPSAVRMQVSNVCIIAVVVEGSLPGWCGPVADE